MKSNYGELFKYTLADWGRCLKCFVEETPFARRWRIMRDCAQWEFDAYRVLSAAGFADRDPVRDTEYQDYLRYKAEDASKSTPAVIRFRRWTSYNGPQR